MVFVCRGVFVAKKKFSKEYNPHNYTLTNKHSDVRMEFGLGRDGMVTRVIWVMGVTRVTGVTIDEFKSEGR